MTLDLSFHAVCTESYITGINKYLGVPYESFDIEIGKPSITVDYSLEPESRQWGIKEIYISIKKVITEIEWEIASDDFTPEEKKLFIDAGGTEYANETIGGRITIDSTIKLKDKAWDVTGALEFKKDGALSVDLVEIDLPSMKIIIS